MEISKKTNNKKKKWIWFILIMIMIVIGVTVYLVLKGTSDYISLAQFESYLSGSDAKIITAKAAFGINGTAEISGNYLVNGKLVHYVVQTSQYTINHEWGGNLLVTLQKGGYGWAISSLSKSSFVEILSSILPMVIMIVFYILIFWFMTKSSGAAGGAGGMFGMGKNKAKQTKTNVKFTDVAGIDEEKLELVELVDYLKNPKKYADAGARAPKGVLMEGPPGTGKTLLAKAVAGEAGVAFFTISGSEFEEMFVGVGASRVREMFNDAKKTAPAIIFIDEIDAVGRKRNSNLGTGTNEQTLNQLLVEMDGFGTNSGIIVMAATNRADVLDPALLRPGRFDRVIQVSLPDIKERAAILKLHAKGKKIDSSIDWKRIAERTPGFSGAQLENVLNEAAILMVREKRKIIGIKEIDEAIDRVVGGPAKKSRAMTLQDKQIVSYHESGHALIGLKLDSASKVQKVTIIPRGNAGGYTIMTPKDETVFSSKKDLYATITGYLGGRAAEEIMFGKENVTTGAHDDLDKATSIARRMVVQFGMSDLGMTKYLTMAEESYGKMEGTYSDETALKIDLEIQKILDACYIDALKIIKENMTDLELLAESLRVLETITAEQIDFIDKNHKLPDEVIKEKESLEVERAKKETGDIVEINIEDILEEASTIEEELEKDETIDASVIAKEDFKEEIEDKTDSEEKE